jgi:DNA polymerase-4
VDRAIIHLDMDAFYASVEQRDNPALQGKPVIVGGHPTRGVVLAASYEVRPFGVRSAMSMVEATRRAPQAIVVPPRSAAYAEASEEVFAILETVTPLIEPLSLDEAFLDVSESRALFGGAGDIARQLRRRIREQTRLAASAGIAGVKFVAKIASDLAKPDGQREIAPDETRAFLARLPIGKLWGVGQKTEAALAPLGLRTIGDLAARDPDWLERRVPGGRHLWELSQGIDDRPVVPDQAAKSIGAEETFDEDREAHELAPAIHAQALRVGRRLRRAGVKGRVVQLKIKLADFTLLTRRMTLGEATDDGQTLYRAATELLAREQLPRRVRLTGVAAHDLTAAGGAPQLALFAATPTRADRLNAALDRIASKYGSDAVVPADVAELERPEVEVKNDKREDRSRERHDD